MNYKTLHKLFTYCIASIWFINGMLCKVLNLVPRHQLIVERILGNSYGRTFTLFIGLSEIVMSAWILSGKLSKLNAIMQILIIATMNTIEFLLAPDLLLWGKYNAAFALLLIIAVGYNEFYLNRKN